VGGIATHTIFGQAWADGVTVSVYPGAAQPSGWDAQPMGLPVTSAVVANGNVTFTDLSERNRYVAYAGGTSRRFLVPERRVDSLRGRVEDLEQGAEDTQLSADSYVATYPVLNAHAAISQAVLDAATDGKVVKLSGTRHLNGTIAITQSSAARPMTSTRPASTPQSSTASTRTASMSTGLPSRTSWSA
jgi:hypothetical protein